MASRTYPLIVKAIDINTVDTKTISFEIPTHLKAEYDYEPGQYLTIELNINGKRERRAYSMSSSPLTDVYPAVTVKRLTGGLVSNYLNDNVLVGTELAVLPPHGEFTVDLNPENKTHYFLFGAGSGITPLMSMVKSILQIEPQSKISLLYGNRQQDSIIFYDELNQLRNNNPDRLNIIYTLSQPKGLWFGETGRIDTTKVKNILDLYAGDALPKQYLLCGPGDMIKLVEETLLTAGIQESFIKKEFFVLPSKEKTVSQETNANTGKDFEVTIKVDRTSHTIKVGSHETILDAALDADIDVPFSCMSAACSTCRAKLESGTVSMEDDEILSKKEKAQNYILSCQAHATSEGVVVNFDV